MGRASRSSDSTDPAGLQTPSKSEEVNCPDLVLPQGREVLPRCRISVTGQGQLAHFCRDCQVQQIRAQPHCRHLRFQSRVRVGLLGQAGVRAVLTCDLTGRRVRLARCQRCLSYQE